MGEFVRLEVDTERRVGTIRLDRPPMNAISNQVWLEIGECAQEAADHPDVGAVVVWGGPKVFAAGADIKQFPEIDYQAMKAGGAVLQRAMDTLARVPLVTIAVVNGYALGGGCEVALACDFRFAADNAKLGQPEVLLGLIPGAGGTQRLPRLVGLSRAKELLFSGRMVDMVEAQQIGLVDEVHPADEVYDRAVEAAARYAAGPFALRLIKQAVEDGTELPIDQALRLEQSLFAEAFGTDDARTGIASFIENGPGKAKFTGR
ncbi:enoyl-CoA hydratase/isomerase family protein [Egicoccus sp. AB-alg2]|uniref:enoyl-CoA hydratase/isomerase family protein n=1 Tax=Egicoccus sp. AB-alg2 TaxID=3242693 RepID=UPI00359ED9BF